MANQVVEVCICVKNKLNLIYRTDSTVLPVDLYWIQNLGLS